MRFQYTKVNNIRSKFNFGKININKLRMLIKMIMLKRQNNTEITKIFQFINQTKKEMFIVGNMSKEINEKILVIISCHTQGRLRWNAINSIMTYLSRVDNIDIIIVNSSDLPLSAILKQTYINQYLKYFEIPNDQFYGFSKWYYGLLNTNYDTYKYVTFINDSILINNDIKHFFDFTLVKDMDLYGYNDSNQITHHYQSYLFSIKSECVDNFIKLFNDYKHLIQSYNDVVNYYELKMGDYFEKKDCFLKLTTFSSQNGQNIFFTNDNLYFRIKNQGCLPFIKLKRITMNNKLKLI
jgi:hypothetical protein